MNLLGAPLLLLCLLPAEGKAAPKFPVGKETTFITGPLDSDGYIDYEAALNDRLGKGITPRNNAVVLLWKALGPTASSLRGMPPEHFKRLGIEGPPKKGDYFIELWTYLRTSRKLESAEREQVSEQRTRASSRPWTAKDFPHLAAWLKANEKPLAVVVEATRRPDYFSPQVSRRDKKGQRRESLLGAVFGVSMPCREVSQALTARAMLRLAEGKADEAWQDLLACHRLGRLVARGNGLVDLLLGVGIDGGAYYADLAYLDRTRLTSRQFHGRLKDLQGLPPMPLVADRLDLGERLVFLDEVQLLRRFGTDHLDGLFGGPNEKERLALKKLDWDVVLRHGNAHFDCVVAALRLRNRAEREKALDRAKDDLDSLRKAIPLPERLVKLFDLWFDVRGPRNTQQGHDRAEQRQRNLLVAFALAAYQRDHGRYPARLDDLAPKYLAKVPGDLFSGKALIYRPADKGYLFYSVGVNGKDDGGRSYDQPPGDDLPVRMPLPEPRRRK